MPHPQHSIAALAAAATLLLGTVPEAAASEPLRLSAAAFGGRAAVEVRDLPRDQARDAALAALEEISRVERLTDPDGTAPGGVGELNRAAGGGPVPVDPLLADLLQRSLVFCTWSEGAHGPLGGRLYELWGFGRRRGQPAEGNLGAAVASARCNHLRVDREAGTAELAAVSRVHLFGFAQGYAVDRAVDALRKHGASNGLVELGPVVRPFGPGVDGQGWGIQPPAFPGLEDPLPPVRLRSGAFVALRSDDAVLAGSAGNGPYIDQRSGQPAEGVVGVLVVTELAVDAQALAATMFVTGTREGQFRLGALSPRPAVLWLMGGTPPLIIEHHWGELSTQ